VLGRGLLTDCGKHTDSEREGSNLLLGRGEDKFAPRGNISFTLSALQPKGGKKEVLIWRGSRPEIRTNWQSRKKNNAQTLITHYKNTKGGQKHG